MKIGLVCPYIYPERGGVAQHVQHLYENLRLRGHDVRIITASHGPQRASEGDILRIGVGFSVPLNGSIGTLTFSPRYISQVRDLLERERFDVLHLHEPMTPTICVACLVLATIPMVSMFTRTATASCGLTSGIRELRASPARSGVRAIRRYAAKGGWRYTAITTARPSRA